MNRKLLQCIIVFLCVVGWSATGFSKVKTLQKPNAQFDFTAVQQIVVLPITAKNVDIGKVAPKRVPKIRAMLKKMRTILREHTITMTKDSDTTIKFTRRPQRKFGKNILYLQLNFDQFDNGHQVARLVPFAGKGKVTLRAKLLDFRKRVLAEYSAQKKSKGSMSGRFGGFDADVLYAASMESYSAVMKKVAKLTKLKGKYLKKAPKKFLKDLRNLESMFREEAHEVKKGS